MRRAFYLVAYDVSDPKRLRQVGRLVKSHATGGQKSVFECWLSEHERKSLEQALRRLLSGRDRAFILRLDPRRQARCLGLARPPGDPSIFYYG